MQVLYSSHPCVGGIRLPDNESRSFVDCCISNAFWSCSLDRHAVHISLHKASTHFFCKIKISMGKLCPAIAIHCQLLRLRKLSGVCRRRHKSTKNCEQRHRRKCFMHLETPLPLGLFYIRLGAHIIFRLLTKIASCICSLKLSGGLFGQVC